jgi:hypothetical protein
VLYGLCQLHIAAVVVARISLRPGETPEQAQERRMRESQQVDERVVSVSDLSDWDRETAAAGDKLVVLEVRQTAQQYSMHATNRASVRLVCTCWQQARHLLVLVLLHK